MLEVLVGLAAIRGGHRVRHQTHSCSRVQIEPLSQASQPRGAYVLTRCLRLGGLRTALHSPEGRPFQSGW